MNDVMSSIYPFDGPLTQHEQLAVRLLARYETERLLREARDILRQADAVAECARNLPPLERREVETWLTGLYRQFAEATKEALNERE